MCNTAKKRNPEKLEWLVTYPVHDIINKAPEEKENTAGHFSFS